LVHESEPLERQRIITFHDHINELPHSKRDGYQNLIYTE